MVYLDHAATTPLDARVVAAMQPYLDTVYGNSHSPHRVGREAERAVERARERIARVLNCAAAEIVFTGGGTESDNLAVRGAAWSRRQHGAGHLVSSSIEHSAVSRTVEQMTRYMGFTATVVPVDAYGVVDPEAVGDALADHPRETALVSVMYANNEIGTVQPVARIAAVARAAGAWVHTDAVQAPGQLALDVQALGVDLLSLSAHKFYGPKGVGLLYVREGIDLVPSQTGGSHEEGRRAGTLNTAGIVGMAEALELAEAEREAREAHYRALRDQLHAGILARVPGAIPTGHPEQRLPSHTSFAFDGLDGNMLVVHLDLRGVAASSASACKTGNPEPSAILLALGLPAETAAGSLRLSVGKDTTEADIGYAIDVIAETVEKLYRLRQRLS
jgi:cysteine desulfurase